MQLPDWDDPAARTAWIVHMVPLLLRREGSPLTLSKLVWAINAYSNPRRYKKKGEYKFQHEEVEVAIELLIRDYVISADTTRHKYDPSGGRKRYWFSNLLDSLARASSEGEQEI